MNRRLFLLLALAFSLACTSTGQTAKLRVLFIGNSYTYYNSMPSMLAALANEAKTPIEFEAVTQGGATLKTLWDNGKAPEALRHGKWDYVILQEQSMLGPSKVIDGIPQINEPTLFHESVRLYNRQIKALGAKTILYMTWARQDSPDKQPLLTKAYQEIGKEIGATVVPVGLAWQSAFKQKPDLVLHVADKSHPNPLGSYLAACVLYATLFGKSPVGLTSTISGPQVNGLNQVQKENAEIINLSANEARFLQKLAWETVQAQRSTK